MKDESSARRAGVFRQDVRSMHAYAIQHSFGLVKLDAMENPFRLPEALQRSSASASAGSRSTAIRRRASTMSSSRSRNTSRCPPVAS